MAFFSPLRAPDMTSLTSRPWVFNNGKKLVQNASFLAVFDLEAEHFPAPVGRDTAKTVA